MSGGGCLMENLTILEPGSLKPALEALLLSSDEAVGALRLAQVLGVSAGEVRDALAELSEEYARANRGFQLREVAGGWRLFTHPAFHDQVEALVLSWDTRSLSQAALEALAVIAYHQPVTREGVRAVRGVNSDGVIASLREKGLVRVVGRTDAQAELLGTTTAFLERFGLRSVDDLPPLEDFAPDEEARRFIRERLSSRPATGELAEVADDIDDERDLLGGDYGEGGERGGDPGDQVGEEGGAQAAPAGGAHDPASGAGEGGATAVGGDGGQAAGADGGEDGLTGGTAPSEGGPR